MELCIKNKYKNYPYPMGVKGFTVTFKLYRPFLPVTSWLAIFGKYY